ncbi:HAD family hydrolase [Rossellomorea marisflavi]|uniref:HAD family hydrolase n=1 Tax=Rossellomorea marisflavi TaxID=189381 RepID=UPI0009A712C6|nr:HAD family hydrolase [Rossellomorea marisflavi]
MIKAVVFDFDGLIIDTEYALYESFCELLNMSPSEMPIKEYATYIGTDSGDLYEFIRTKSRHPISIEELMKKSHALHKGKLEEPVSRDGVTEYLEDAKKSGLKIGLASSSNRKWVDTFLGKLDLLHYFDSIQTADDVEKVKPDPALYQNVISRLGINPSEAIAFEDSLNGSKAAIAAGLNCVIVTNRITEHLAFEGFDLMLRSMKERNLSDVIDIVGKSVRKGK